MEKQVIISEAIRFATEGDVYNYGAFSPEALPRNDVEFNEATKIVVGYQHIVLFGRYGRRMAVLRRKDFVGMAVDGVPYQISGDGFLPFEIEDVPVDGSALDDLMGRPVEALDAVVESAKPYAPAVDENGEEIMY